MAPGTVHLTCPECEAEVECDILRVIEEFDVRGEAIPVEVEYCRCPECGEEVENLRTETDPFDVAYREYRRRHDLLQPEEIRALREQRGASVEEFAALLNLSPGILSSYEAGALQSEEHDRAIRDAASR